MPYHRSIYIMIHRCIILCVICKVCHLPTNCPDFIHRFLFIQKFPHSLFCITDSFRCVEDCRFIHIIPEAFNPCIRQDFIFSTEPFPCIRIQHIREMRISRPYGCNIITSVLSFAEIIVCHTFLIYLIAFFNLYTCINNRDQMNLFLFHVSYIP